MGSGASLKQDDIEKSLSDSSTKQLTTLFNDLPPELKAKLKTVAQTMKVKVIVFGPGKSETILIEANDEMTGAAFKAAVKETVKEEFPEWAKCKVTRTKVGSVNVADRNMICNVITDDDESCKVDIELEEDAPAAEEPPAADLAKEEKEEKFKFTAKSTTGQTFECCLIKTTPAKEPGAKFDLSLRTDGSVKGKWFFSGYVDKYDDIYLTKDDNDKTTLSANYEKDLKQGGEFIIATKGMQKLTWTVTSDVTVS